MSEIRIEYNFTRWWKWLSDRIQRLFKWRAITPESLYHLFISDSQMHMLLVLLRFRSWLNFTLLFSSNRSKMQMMWSSHSYAVLWGNLSAVASVCLCLNFMRALGTVFKLKLPRFDWSVLCTALWSRNDQRLINRGWWHDTKRASVRLHLAFAHIYQSVSCSLQCYLYRWVFHWRDFRLNSFFALIRYNFSGMWSNRQQIKKCKFQE